MKRHHGRVKEAKPQRETHSADRRAGSRMPENSAKDESERQHNSMRDHFTQQQTTQKSGQPPSKQKRQRNHRQVRISTQQTGNNLYTAETHWVLVRTSDCFGTQWWWRDACRESQKPPLQAQRPALRCAVDTGLRDAPASFQCCERLTLRWIHTCHILTQWETKRQQNLTFYSL